MNAHRIQLPFILFTALVLAGCGPGQFLGPTVTPSPTKTPRPTATLIPTMTPSPTVRPSPTPQVLLLESFDNPHDPNTDMSAAAGDPDNGIWKLGGGVLSWNSTASRPQEVSISMATGKLPSDIDVSVDITFEKITGQGDFAGVYCRASVNPQKQWSYYQFSLVDTVSDEGFEINKVVNGQSSPLASYGFTTPILANQASNRLEAVCAGDHLRFYLNDQLLFDTSDDTLKDGSLFIDVLGSAPGAAINFKNLVVKAP